MFMDGVIGAGEAGANRLVLGQRRSERGERAPI